MKKSIIRLFSLVALVSSVALTSCDTEAEGEIYSGDAAKSYSFASSKQISEVTADNNGKVIVPVNRGVKSGEQTLTLDVTYSDNCEGVVKVESNTVTFKDGEGTANVVIDFGSVDKLGTTAKYEVAMKLPEGIVSPSGKSAIDVVVSRKLTWKSMGVGEYYCWLFDESWEQEVEKAEEGPIYRLPDCIVMGAPIIFTLSEDGQTCVAFDDQATGYVYDSYGMIYAHYLSEYGMAREGNKLYFPLRYYVEISPLGENYDCLTMPE